MELSFSLVKPVLIRFLVCAFAAHPDLAKITPRPVRCPPLSQPKIMNQLRFLDLAVILLGMLGMGWYFARRQTDTESYFAAQRPIPARAMGMSMFATLISSLTFIAYPGGAHAGNRAELTSGFMVVVVLVLVGAVIIPFFRHVVGMSAYQIIPGC